MKRAPKPGETALAHTTVETGDCQTFAVCLENYNPDALRLVGEMVKGSLMGYRLGLGPKRESFMVIRDDGTPDGIVLSINSIHRTENRIDLLTSILLPMDPDEAMMLADLEQCAALMLLGILSFDRLLGELQ